ncbi:MAG: non-homologous end-joining DNA ligase [Candidatus Latescibacterota bacterium]
MPPTEVIIVDSIEVRITHSDKILFPDDGITKNELAHYYARIAEKMLPHTLGRPVTMHRFPRGIDHEGFFHKEAPYYFPPWLHRTNIQLRMGETQQQVVFQHGADMVYLANQNCITPHVWLSREGKLNFPDRMIFDLDPGDESGEDLLEGVHALKRILDAIGFPSYPVSTGSRGIHVYIPLDGSADFDAVRSLAGEIAELAVKENPERFTVEQRIEKREQRLFFDTNRNAYGQTVAAPYSVRALPGAPVAAPLEWSELEGKEFDPRRYTIRNIFHRLSQKRDPLADILTSGFPIGEAEKKLSDIKHPEMEI